MYFSVIFLQSALVLLFSAHFVLSTVFEKSQHAASLRIVGAPAKAQPKSNFFMGPELAKKLPRCGEWQNTATGGIFYKAFEPVLEHERCVWIIGSPGAVGYTVDVQYLDESTNQVGSGQELSLLGVQGGDRGNVVLSSYLPTSTGVFTISDANLIIVTFHNSELSAPRTGFVLEYEAIEEGNITGSSPSSTHTIFMTPTFDSKYPPTTSAYDNYELATFVFPPSGNIYAGNSVNVFVKIQGLETCLDSLLVYIFNVDSPPESSKWQFVDRLCNNVTSQAISSDDMLLVLFRSDSSNVESGFTFSFLSC